MPDDPALTAFKLVLACLPPAVYLWLLGAAQFAAHPVVVTGRRDLSLLGMALLPMLVASLDWRELLVAWHIVPALAGLLILLLVLVVPGEAESWVFYNARLPDVRDCVTSSLTAMGVTFEDRPDGLATPDGALTITFSRFAPLNSVTVYHQCASEALQLRLERRLFEGAAAMPAASGFAGLPVMLAGTAAAMVPVVAVLQNFEAVTQLVRRAFGSQ